MDAQEFVHGVMDKLGVSTAAELAEAMRWKRGTERTVARWLAGETRPSFDYVMEMVERAALLNSDGDSPSALEAHRDPLQELEARVQQGFDEIADALARLVTEVRRLSRSRPHAAGQGQ